MATDIVSVLVLVLVLVLLLLLLLLLVLLPTCRLSGEAVYSDQSPHAEPVSL